ncbi:helix-hairpin-helix domain-containing protein [Micromonospora narathiwatensis]|uniref:Helix-hairpin-helix domain-containing protein n=1 Tax=Micromonospora narathiwatensis TaxID=299146 RepID=A0A1A8ZED7_9ACTN|nr:helix-hairpin-helix domain-containing protein [Micromonospora narathiwatensis]SBT42164.1 Helix-hairpin-helix domain-containing protein [Micromonospora narathiwatensis]
MSPSFALWLVGILTVVTGLVIWRVLAGGRTTTDQAAPIVEGDPASAPGDQERHATVVDEVPPPAAVIDEPAPAREEATPVAETTVPPAADAAEPADAEPAADAAEAEDAAAEPAEAEQPATVEPEPASTVTEPVAAEVEPATAPAEPVAPATIPVPRTPVENGAVATAEPATPDNGPADDFRKIQGIGPKMAAGLQDAGIRTYRQLAELDEAALREVIKAAGLRAAPGLATWPQQAKVLAGAEPVLPAAGGNA